MKVYEGFAYTPMEDAALKANRATFERVQHLCKFGTEPDGMHTVIDFAGTGYACSSYRIIDNAASLTVAEIALFCDPTRLLAFGYSAARDSIDIYTD